MSNWTTIEIVALGAFLLVCGSVWLMDELKWFWEFAKLPFRFVRWIMGKCADRKAQASDDDLAAMQDEARK